MYLSSNIPYFKCWVRKEFTNAHQKYQGEYLHALAVAVTTIPDRSLSFQVIFTGCEAEDGSQPNIHGGAMWARMPITALVGDIPLETWPERMQTHLVQPWDCSSYNHNAMRIQMAHPSPWLCKIDNEFYKGRYLFTVVPDATITRSEVLTVVKTTVNVAKSAQVELSAECWTFNVVLAFHVFAVT